MTYEKRNNKLLNWYKYFGFSKYYRKNEWITGKIIEVEKNHFNGLVLTVITEGGEIFFNKVNYFKLVDNVRHSI